MTEQQNQEKTSNFCWFPLDQVVRAWVVQQNHEKDLSDYQKRKELYE